MRVRLAFLVVVGLVLTWSAGTARAQKQSSPEQDVGGVYDVDSIIQQAVENISRRYNLNGSQHEFTREMMNKEVSRFLRDHQDEIYPLIRDMTKARFSGQNLSEEQRRRIGKAAKPLVAAAKKAILEANAEWRGILSDEQKKLHDWDLHEMDGQFETIGGGFERMAEGEVVDNPIFPEHKPKTTEPPRPKKPGERKLSPTPAVERTEDGPFEVCVANVIKDYNLDPSQQEAARSILREYKQYVEIYRNAHKKELEEAERKANEARNSGDIEKAKEAEALQEKLSERIRQFLEEMRQRLMSIPREAQKKAYQRQKNDKGLDQASTKAATESKPAQGENDKPDKKKKVGKSSAKTKGSKRKSGDK
jgi:hypothetical protein